jgi:hypothetical protein
MKIHGSTDLSADILTNLISVESGSSQNVYFFIGSDWQKGFGRTQGGKGLTNKNIIIGPLFYT